MIKKFLKIHAGAILITGLLLASAQEAVGADSASPTKKKRRDVKHFASSTQATFLSGDFGAAEDFEITQYSESLKYIGKKGEVSVASPYIYREGGGVRRAEGIGDVSLKGRYYLVKEGKRMPALDLTGGVKFPTASRKKGLGTGEYDANAGASLLKCFGKFITLADTELNIRQRPPGSDINKLRLDYSAGFGYPLTKKFSSYFFVQGSTRPSQSEKLPLELLAVGTYKLKRSVNLSSYVMVGQSKASPDFALGSGLTVYF